ncbi:formate/nitrite transporter [Hypnocyclicus thermotrophus]|uniref:Formate/nitrite transporter n=1 Tax=Hypnocyclicus thermotrophus TaxID=1627895 RepID=A0AA46I6I1_9FUSO|nr:formate/nitrite transporter family protein [Hypnocyclicus thermotrophus]TDT72416.1 formate/nitrite transporter [Hypnocyclicus thermotrophus]
MYENNITYSKVVKMGEKKSKSTLMNTFLFGVLGGIFIALGYIGYMSVVKNIIKIDKGIAGLLGAAVFPVGIMLCVGIGGELFTSNNLITLSFLNKKTNIKKLIKNWIIVWIGNFIGAIFIAIIAKLAGIYKSSDMYNIAVNMAHHKLELTFIEAVASGFFCNILVSLAVWLSLSSKSLISKIFALWFPVMLFVLSGYQHVVANMYVLSIAKLLDNSIQIQSIFLNNLFPVTIGNALSGGVFIPYIYFQIFNNKKEAIV